MKNKTLLILVACSLVFLPVVSAGMQVASIETVEINPIEEKVKITRECPIGCVCTEDTITCPIIEAEIEEIVCPIGCTCTADSTMCPTIEEKSTEASIKVEIETIGEAKEIIVEKSAPNQVSIKTEKAIAITSEKLIIEENKLSIETTEGKRQIKVSPEIASEKAIATGIQEVKKIELKKEATKPLYSVEGTKRARLLFIFPVTLRIETKIDAGTSEVISVKKPWWSFLAW